MIQQILLALDDSRPGTAAARIAVDLAGALGARERTINVIADGYITERLAGRRIRPNRRPLRSDHT
jgi:nucleotide-binding universal stress UspA family protein